MIPPCHYCGAPAAYRLEVYARPSGWLRRLIRGGVDRHLFRNSCMGCRLRPVREMVRRRPSSGTMRVALAYADDETERDAIDDALRRGHEIEVNAAIPAESAWGR